MLFNLRHGEHVVLKQALEAKQADSEARVVAMAEGVVPGEAPLLDDAQAPVGGPFRYYFADASGIAHESGIEAKLDALADAMVEPAPDDAAQNSRLPAILTYFGQFIDHDITANTDREAGMSVIDGDIEPLARAFVQDNLANLRDGSLGLDSLYGDGEGNDAFSDKVAGLMRHPTLTGKMRLGVGTDRSLGRPPLPADPAVDLPRLGLLLDRGDLTVSELDALDEPLRGVFFQPDGTTPRRSRAIIGDGRNDENLLVAQTHVAMLRLHNVMHDRSGGSFEEARRLTRWHYQWLVVNAYLPLVCDPDVVREVRDAAAPVYQSLFDQHGTPGTARMPMPVEFSVAGFRFGHSMIRGAYDHNRFFGEPKNGSTQLLPLADFPFLFKFTGNGMMDGADTNLPLDWIIEWERFAKTDAGRPVRSARSIDAQIAFPLSEMVNEPPGVFKHLARRNLRRGHKLNVPHAQACIAALASKGIQVPVLSLAQLTSGPTGQAVQDGGFAEETPLWFYLLKEAETLGAGEHLGPLGSHIVANTLIGLVVNDPDSYWNAGNWSPKDGPSFGGDGNHVDSFENMLRFVGML
jgi:hypothetical protein